MGCSSRWSLLRLVTSAATMIWGGDDLGVVALQPAALRGHHPAVRVAGVDSPAGIGRRRPWLAATDPPTGGRFPRRAFGDRALIGVPRGLILGLQLDLCRKQPPAPGRPSAPLHRRP